MSTIAKHNRTGGLVGYLLSRGSTLAFIGFFILGLLTGSLFCISPAEGAVLLRSIINNELSARAVRSFTQLYINGVMGFAGLFIYIYLCINSSKGGLIIYLTPVVYGLSLGSLITSTLYIYGYHSLGYLLCCVFAPKVVQTLLLLSICNKTVRYCKTGTGRRKRGDTFPILLYLVLFAMYFALESILVFLFHGLL